jgi:hypothetical protein
MGCIDVNMCNIAPRHQQHMAAAAACTATPVPALASFCMKSHSRRSLPHCHPQSCTEHTELLHDKVGTTMTKWHGVALAPPLCVETACTPQSQPQARPYKRQRENGAAHPTTPAAAVACRSRTATSATLGKGGLCLLLRRAYKLDTHGMHWRPNALKGED